MAHCAYMQCPIVFLIEPNEKSPLNVEAAELWENQAGMWVLGSLVSWTLSRTRVQLARLVCGELLTGNVLFMATLDADN